jgi:uncharacterized membrane protein
MKTDFSPKLIEWITIAVTLAHWGMVVYIYDALPKVIPVHFDASGTPDGFAEQSQFFLAPLVGFVLFIGLYFLRRFPQIYNYPVPITPENRERQFQAASRLIAQLNLSISIVFAVISWTTFEASIKGTVPSWIFPLVIAIVFAPVFVYLAKALRGS